MTNWNIAQWWSEADQEQRKRVGQIALAAGLLILTPVLLIRAYRDAQPARQPEVFSRLAIEDADGVRTLIRSESDLVKQRDIEGNTPLHVAVLIGSESLVRDLLAAGADPNARNHEGRTPLAETVEGKRPQSAIATALLTAGADPSVKLSGGETPLHLAVTTPGADPALPALFARNHPDALEAIDAAGRTPVQAAEARGHKRAAAALKQVAAAGKPRVAASVN